MHWRVSGGRLGAFHLLAQEPDKVIPGFAPHVAKDHRILPAREVRCVPLAHRPVEEFRVQDLGFRIRRASLRLA